MLKLLIASATLTGFNVNFDGRSLLLIILGIAFRCGLEWYKSVQNDGAIINTKELLISSGLGILGYVIFVILGEVQLDAGDALMIGLAPQTIINEIKAMSPSKALSAAKDVVASAEKKEQNVATKN